MSTEKIGPEQAREFLDEIRDPDTGRFANRHVSKLRVNKLARAMLTAGAYDPEIPLIAFDAGGLLVGGVHNLLAVEASGTTWEFRVKRGIAEDLIPALNEGRAGTAADELYRLGFSDQNQRAAIATQLLHLDSGQYALTAKRAFTAMEVAGRAMAEPLMNDALARGRALYGNLWVNKTITGVAYIAFAQRLGELQAKVLFDRLIRLGNGATLDDAGITTADPEYHLWRFAERASSDDSAGRRAAGKQGNRMWCAFLETGRRLHGNLPGKTLRIPQDLRPSDVAGYVWWREQPAAQPKSLRLVA